MDKNSLAHTAWECKYHKELIDEYIYFDNYELIQLALQYTPMEHRVQAYA
ncbi:MAG: hypothetical protein ACOX8Q_02825 [Christensenellales bacterium]|jgi:hypothetical protein